VIAGSGLERPENMPTPLIIGPVEKAQLYRLRELAASHPVDMTTLMARLETRDGKRMHMRQMSKQTIYLPANFAVTFSIETGHPVGTCRHMSMSVNRADRVPSLEGVWMAAEELGFVGGLTSCQAVWPEELQGHGMAINVVQAVAAVAAGTA
jgi:hypothetical protein